MRILFVCLGNICRSPAAEAIMTHLVAEANLSDTIQCDSAGTGGWHTGDRADPRMIEHCSKRGYDVTSIARKIYPDKDFEEFDYIITMDESNYYNVSQLQKTPEELKGKLFRMSDFRLQRLEKEVPDPYHEGPEGFDLVIDILEDACKGLLRKIKATLFIQSSATKRSP